MLFRTPRLALLLGLFALACGGNESQPAGSSGPGGGGAGGTTSSGGAGTGGADTGGTASGGSTNGCAPDEHTSSLGCDTAISWASGPPVAFPRDHHGTFLVDPGDSTARYLYVAGGFSQASNALTNDVARAPINGDGTLGDWQPAAKLPAAIAGMGVVVTHGEVILAGGFFSDKTWIAPIAKDGSLGAWAAGPALSQKLFHTAAVVHGDFLYVVGGLGGANLDTTSDEVQRSAIGADGSLGAFQTVAHLPYTLSHHVALVDGDTLYVIGGQTGNPNDNSGTPHKEVQIASLAADGSVGPWAAGPMTPAAYSTSAGVVHDGFVYILSGIVDTTANEAGGVPTKNVLRAKLLGPGMLDAWTVDKASALPVAKSHVHQVPVLGNHLYSVSGMSGAKDTPDVEIGTFQ